MAIKVAMTPPQRLSVNITKAAAKKIEKTLRTQTAPMFVEEATNEAQSIYYFARPGSRRHGGVHYTTGFSTEVHSGSGGTGFAALPTMLCKNAAKHAKALEHGTGGSHIVGNTEKGLRIPGVPNTPGVTSADAYGGPPYTKPFEAFAAPITGSKLSQRVAKRVLRATFPR